MFNGRLGSGELNSSLRENIIFPQFMFADDEFETLGILLYGMFLLFLFRANPSDKQIKIFNRNIGKGQCITSLGELQELCGVPVMVRGGNYYHPKKMTVKRWLEYLKEAGLIDFDCSPFGTLITITDYEKYIK